MLERLFGKAPKHSVAESWKLIEGWLGEHAPTLLDRLPAGASAESLDSASERLGLVLPSDLRESWARHDGSGGLGLFNHGSLLSLAEALDCWKDLGEALGGQDSDVIEASKTIKPCTWNDRWFPIHASESGDYLCIDMDPRRPEAAGQVISFRHDEVERVAEAPSLKDWLSNYAESLRRGRFQVSDENTIGEV